MDDKTVNDSLYSIRENGKTNKVGEMNVTQRTGDTFFKYRNDLKKTNDLIVFDLTGVSVLTPEFARSCFGTLIKQVGIQTLRNRIRFLNQNEMINDILKKTMARAILESYPC